MHSFDRPIPKNAGVVDGWQNTPIVEKDEPLVQIGTPNSFPDLITIPIYSYISAQSPYRDEFIIPSAKQSIHVRESIARQLQYARELLPNGYRLVILDGYRPSEVQETLRNQFTNELITRRPNLDRYNIERISNKYVSKASVDPSCPSPHATGGAVDVTIIKDYRMLDFGTAFDSASKKSALRYFEENSNEENIEARTNRRLLFWVMKGAGFAGYEHEWWHFNSINTQMGAVASGNKTASLGYIEAPNELNSKTAIRHNDIIIAVDRMIPRQ